MERTYKEYATLMEKIGELEKERDDLKKILIRALEDEPGGKKETSYGKFTLAKRLSWLYSDRVKALEDKVKIAKDKEQKKGTAISTATSFVVFTVPKE